MNKKQILLSLNKIANELDVNNLYKEASTLTKVMTKIALLSPNDDYDDDGVIEDFSNHNISDLTNKLSNILEPMLKEFTSPDSKINVLSTVLNCFLMSADNSQRYKLQLENASDGMKIVEIINICEQFSSDNNLARSEMQQLLRMKIESL